jgi:molecular chaperone DnaK
MNEMGLLRVEAVELKTGKKLNMELQIQGVMSEDQIGKARSAVARYAVGE